MAGERFDVVAWLGRLGASGKLVVAGAVIGVVSMFLPLVSFRVSGVGAPASFGGMFNMPAPHQSVLDDSRSVLALVAYVAALVFSFLLYKADPLPGKRGWGLVVAGGVALLIAAAVLLRALDGVGAVGGFGATWSVRVGAGAYANLAGAVLVAAGAALKAREQGLFRGAAGTATG